MQNRIRRYDGAQICKFWWIALVSLCVRVRACVLSAPYRESLHVCAHYACTPHHCPASDLSITRLTALFGAKNAASALRDESSAATMYLCADIVIWVDPNLLVYFFRGLSHSRHLWATTLGSQSATCWEATRYMTLKIFCKGLFLFIANDFWWTSRGPNKHVNLAKRTRASVGMLYWNTFVHSLPAIIVRIASMNFSARLFVRRFYTVRGPESKRCQDWTTCKNSKI